MFETGPNRDEAAVTLSAKLRKALTAVPEEKPFAFSVPPRCREQRFRFWKNFALGVVCERHARPIDGRWSMVHGRAPAGAMALAAQRPDGVRLELVAERSFELRGSLRPVAWRAYQQVSVGVAKAPIKWE
jgi:hypothetical protein